MRGLLKLSTYAVPMNQDALHELLTPRGLTSTVYSGLNDCGWISVSQNTVKCIHVYFVMPFLRLEMWLVCNTSKKNKWMQRLEIQEAVFSSSSNYVSVMLYESSGSKRKTHFAAGDSTVSVSIAPIEECMASIDIYHSDWTSTSKVGNVSFKYIYSCSLLNKGTSLKGPFPCHANVTKRTWSRGRNTRFSWVKVAVKKYCNMSNP